MAISWPSSLPKALQRNYSMQPDDRRTASSSVGTAFFEGFSGNACSADCTVFLSPSQAAVFEKFERDTLVQGTKWFLFPIWYAGGVHTELCRFKTRPKASNKHGFWMEYSFSLYIQRRSELIPECMIKLFSCWPPCFFVEFSDSLDATFRTLSHVTRQRVNSALAEMHEE